MGMLSEETGDLGFAKVGIHGFPGSGKSHTAVLMAIGISKQFCDGAPVAMFDTEKGSAWLKPIFDKAGVKLLTAKKRSFIDLMAFTKELPASGAGVFVIDSVTHPWNELMEAALQKFKTKRLEFHHWNHIKPEWARFADWFLNVEMHGIICGRAGYDYEMQEHPTKPGKKELIKAGTKMRVEGQFGFEPSLCLEIEAIQLSREHRDIHEKGLLHRAYVLKTRGGILEGAEFDNPSYSDFAPWFDQLNPEKGEKPVDTDTSSEGTFDDQDDGRWRRNKNKEITLEKIKVCLVKHDLDGTSKEAKKGRVEILEKHFGTAAWSEITDMHLEDMVSALAEMELDFAVQDQPGGDPDVDI